MKKIALIVDKDNWAFYNIATNIKKYLQNEFEITIFVREYIENIVTLIFALQDYDLVHFFWRGDLSLFDNEFVKEYLKYSGIDYNLFYNKYISKLNITTSVYDHLFLEKKDFDFTNKILNISKNYSVCSKKLFDIYQKKFIKKPAAIITDGIDLNLFNGQQKTLGKKIVIGWVGNSNWGREYYEDAKGVKTILNPSIKILKDKGYNIIECYADSSKKFIEKAKMPEYYKNIDILICSSLFEGTPNPVLEAMASGIPIVTTNVGVVNELFGKKQKKFIMKERTVNELVSKLEELINNKKLYKDISKENLNSIKKWVWEKKAEDFKSFFKANL